MPIVKFESSAPTFERAIPLGSHSSPRREGLTELELDSYQIALVPLPIRARGSAPEYGAMTQLLFLDLERTYSAGPQRNGPLKFREGKQCCAVRPSSY